MHALNIPATNLFTNTVQQTVANFASRASNAIHSFESDLQSGDVAGAQSFLSALEQKAAAQGAAPAGSNLATQFTQVSNDLQSGNLTAAKSDFSTLATGLAQIRHSPAQPKSTIVRSEPGSFAMQNSAASQNSASAPPSSPMSELQSLNVLAQGAYNTALNLTLPTAVPSLSLNSW